MIFAKNTGKNNFLSCALVFILFLAPLKMLFPAGTGETLEKELMGASGAERIDILVKLSLRYTRSAPQKAINYGKEALTLLKGKKNSTGTEAQVWGHLCDAYRTLGDYSKALECGAKGRELAEKIDDKGALKYIYAYIGDTYRYMGDYRSALQFFSRSLRLFQESKITQDHAAIYVRIALVYSNLGKYPEALELYLKALDISKKFKSKTGMAIAFTNLGALYKEMGDAPRAEEFFFKAHALYKEIGALHKLAHSYFNIAVSYYGKKDYRQALNYNVKALKIYEKIGNKSAVAASLINIGLDYFMLHQPDKALEYLFKSLQLSEQIKDKKNIAESLLNIGGIYWRQGKYMPAQQYLHRSLNVSKTMGDKKKLQQGYQQLAGAQIGLEDYKNAYENLRKSHNLYLALNNDETRTKLNQIESGSKMHAKETEIQLMEKNNHIQELEIDKLQMLRNAFIGVFIFFLVLQLVIYSRYRLKKKLNRLLEEKNRQMQTANEKLTESEGHLWELNRTKDKFFSIIAHDLKNPLYAVTSTSELLSEVYPQLSPEKTVHFLENLYNSSKNLGNLLENLLQWGQSQTGQTAYSPETLDLSAVVQHAVSLLREYAQSKEIKLYPEVEEGMVVYADRNMVLTILRNLISNGIKFTESGGEVTVTAGDTDDFVRVFVTDTGMGIAPQWREELFKLDSTVSQKGTRGETGTGLGLIICKELVEKHGGDIRVEDRACRGSSFSFTLPKANKNL